MRSKKSKAQAQGLNLLLTLLAIVFLIIIYFAASFFISGKNKSIVIGKEINEGDESYRLLKEILFSEQEGRKVYEYIYLYLNGNEDALENFKEAFKVLADAGYNYALAVFLKHVVSGNEEKIFEINEIEEPSSQLILPYSKTQVIVIKFELKK